MNRPALIAALAALALAGGSWAYCGRGQPPAAIGTGVPIVVELFSAEGCASCPPADAYVAGLDLQQPIEGVAVIAMELHVDYWDRLGWTDPFGAPAFTDRQHGYASVLPDHRTFTPEIVISGNRQMPGGDEDRARALMLEAAQEPRARVTLDRVSRGKIAIDIVDIPPTPAGDSVEAWLAITESHLESKVEAGENRGRTLAHAPIVRALSRVGIVESGTFHAEASVTTALSWKPSALHFIAFAQEVRSRRIVGAGVL